MTTITEGSRSLLLLCRVHLDWILVPSAIALALFLVTGLLHI